MSDLIKIPPIDDMSYEAGEWHNLRLGMRLTFSQKLEWLEDALELAQSIQIDVSTDTNLTIFPSLKKTGF